LTQAGFKLEMMVTFGQPLFWSASSPPPPIPDTEQSKTAVPLRVVLQADPTLSLFGTEYFHQGPELVLLPDIAYTYSPVSVRFSSVIAPSEAAAPPTPTKRAGSSFRRLTGRKSSAKPEESWRANRSSTEGSGIGGGALLSGEGGLEGEHCMEAYLRNIKAKIRGKPQKVPLPSTTTTTLPPPLPPMPPPPFLPVLSPPS